MLNKVQVALGRYETHIVNTLKWYDMNYKSEDETNEIETEVWHIFGYMESEIKKEKKYHLKFYLIM